MSYRSQQTKIMFPPTHLSSSRMTAFPLAVYLSRHVQWSSEVNEYYDSSRAQVSDAITAKIVCTGLLMALETCIMRTHCKRSVTDYGKSIRALRPEEHSPSTLL